MATVSKQEMLRALFEEYGLHYDKENPDSKDNDVFVHKHYTIITRSGIQKIEKKAGIKCKIMIADSGRDFCNVEGNGTSAKGETYYTLASAHEQNSTNKYYVEMAEKRCRSRLILTLAGLYEHGVFSEDEADSFAEEIKTQRAGGSVQKVTYKGER